MQLLGRHLGGGGHELLQREAADQDLHLLGADELAAYLGTSLQDGLSLLAVARRDAEQSSVVTERPSRIDRWRRQGRHCCTALQLRFVSSARAQADAESFRALLRAAAPPVATVKRDGVWARLPVSDVTVGDVVRIEVGGIVPADAIVTRCKEDAMVMALGSDGAARTREVRSFCTDRSLAESHNVLRAGDVLLRGQVECIAIVPCDAAVLEARRERLRGSRAAASAVIKLQYPEQSAEWEGSADGAAHPGPSAGSGGGPLPTSRLCQQLCHNHLLLRGRREAAAFGRSTLLLCQKEALAAGRLEVHAVSLGMRVYTREEVGDAAASSPTLFQRLCSGAAMVSDADVAQSWLYPAQEEDAGERGRDDFSDSALMGFADRWTALAGMDAPDWQAVDGTAARRVAMHPHEPAQPVQVTAHRSGTGLRVHAAGSPGALLPFCRRFTFDPRWEEDAGGMSTSSSRDSAPRAPLASPAAAEAQQRASEERELTPAALARVEGLVRYLEGQHGLSVTALAEATLPPRDGGHDLSREGLLRPPQGLTLLGLLGLRDPPREGAAGWVQMLRMMGLEVRLVSDGAGPAALQLAKAVGLRHVQQGEDEDWPALSPEVSPRSFQVHLGAPQALSPSPQASPAPTPTSPRAPGRRPSGERLIASASAETAARSAEGGEMHAAIGDVRTRSAFAGLSPAEKAYLVRALQRLGHKVLLVAGSLSDLPAVLAADCSVAVKQSSDAVRECCDALLADDGLQVVVDSLQLARSELIIRSDSQPLSCPRCAVA
eukprot:TRINITY_DN27874_c0_g1_i2.p1 TRINITY_DN27874_c0_g1~~TRINITY_DN27874_c0_g1_i2.p1  ORF type:complete len:798 (+),score=227.84 TRINITY_DN27874_c0_g1_i2:72-2396(+)